MHAVCCVRLPLEKHGLHGWRGNTAPLVLFSDREARGRETTTTTLPMGLRGAWLS